MEYPAFNMTSGPDEILHNLMLNEILLVLDSGTMEGPYSSQLSLSMINDLFFRKCPIIYHTRNKGMVSILLIIG